MTQNKNVHSFRALEYPLNLLDAKCIENNIIKSLSRRLFLIFSGVSYESVGSVMCIGRVSVMFQG